MRLAILLVVVAVFPSAAAAQDDAIGSFLLYRSLDTVTVADRSFIVTPGTTITRERTPLLMWRCLADGLNVIYAFDRPFLGNDFSEVRVVYGFEGDAPSEIEAWELMPNSESAWMPMRGVWSFTKRAARAATVTVRVIDRDGEQLTDSFVLDGLMQALPFLQCYSTAAAR